MPLIPPRSVLHYYLAHGVSVLFFEDLVDGWSSPPKNLRQKFCNFRGIFGALFHKNGGFMIRIRDEVMSKQHNVVGELLLVV